MDKFPWYSVLQTQLSYKQWANNQPCFNETWKLPWDAAVVWVMNHLYKTVCS